MKKFLKSLAYVLVVVFALSFTAVGPLGASAAPAPAKTSAPDTTTSATQATPTPTPKPATTPKPTVKPTATPAPKPVATPAPTAKPDAVTSASVVNKIFDFEKSIGKNGKWIIAITKDLYIYKPLVLEGNFRNEHIDPVTGLGAVQRKIALYTQDDKRNVTHRFTLTVPKLTISSPNASIQHGTFVGNLYVTVPYFQLVDTKVKGNIYFTTVAAQTSFTMDSTSSVSGKQILQLPADAVSAASVVDQSADFEKALGIDGKWIIATTKDLTIDHPITLEGFYRNEHIDPVTGLGAVQRKIALYTQDDKHVVTARFTLTAPKLTILSPMASIQHGTFKGDLYVSVPYFSLVDAKVDGNIYFTSVGAQSTFSMDAKSSVTGKQVLQLPVDAVSSASVVDNGAAFEKAIGIDGKWIIATTKDLAINHPITLEGNFRNEHIDPVTGLGAVQRKIALYTQDDKRNVTARFTLVAPKLTILSPMASIQHGTFRGDVYVSVPNFSLVDAKVDGNIYFTTKQAKDTFTMDSKSSVTGKQILKSF
jgi:hypothetical protein